MLINQEKNDYNIIELKVYISLVRIVTKCDLVSEYVEVVFLGLFNSRGKYSKHLTLYIWLATFRKYEKQFTSCKELNAS